MTVYSPGERALGTVRFAANRPVEKSRAASDREELYEVSSLDVDHAGIAAAQVIRWSFASDFSVPDGTTRREKEERHAQAAQS